MEIREIIHLLHVLWNHEPTSDFNHRRMSKLPQNINEIFWAVADQDNEHAFFDNWETAEQDKWGKQAWQ